MLLFDKTPFITFFLVFAVLFPLSGTSLSEDYEARMEKRADRVAKLKKDRMEVTNKCFEKAKKKHTDREKIQSFLLECRSKSFEEEHK